jgi:replicative DNA helicase
MSATIGKLFVAALVADGKVSTLLEFGKSQVMFTPTELPVFEFVAAFAKQYGKIPDTATIEAHTDEEIPTAAEPAEYYHDLLQMRWIERELKKSMKVAADLLGATGKDPLQALEMLRGCVTGLVAHQQQHQLVDFRDAYDLIVPDYVSKYTAEADGGVMLGWPTVDEMTGGLVRGDLASFIGRIALGKTWQMLKGCHHGWKHQGACQLFVSMEMKTLPISQRLAAMEAHVPAIQVKNAALTTIGLGKLKGSLLEIKNAKSALWVVDGNFTATVDDVYALARQLKPDSIWIDGGYLLKHPTERDRFRRVAENADLIKQMLADLAPTVCSWQFARSGSKKAKKKGETADLDDIGYTDAIAQVSSLVLGLYQPESIETTKSRDMKILKGRNGETGQFRTHWDFIKMNFDELVEENIEELSFV